MSEAEAAATAAQEEKEKAETKLAAAKSEHEKAVLRAKATGVLPALSGISAASNEKRCDLSHHKWVKGRLVCATHKNLPETDMNCSKEGEHMAGTASLSRPASNLVLSVFELLIYWR